MDTPESATNMAARSKMVPRRSAEMTPTPTPTTSQMTAAPSASDSVMGSRLMMSGHTGVWSRNE